MNLLKIKKKGIVSRETISFLVLLVVFFSPISLSATPYITAKSAMVMDLETGSIFYDNNIDEKLGIASITKLMSVYVIFDEMAKQEIALEDKAQVSERASTLKPQSPSMSGAYFNVNSKYTYEELLKLAIVYSDNTATVVLAENLSGTEKEHVNKMNVKAKELGMLDSHFYNVSGLVSGDYKDAMIEGVNKTDYNYSTARDLGKLTHSLLAKYPQITEYTSIPYITHEGYDLYNYNLMLPDQDFEYAGVTGLKTGTSNESGPCFVSLYTDASGKQFITVVLGASNGNDRFWQTTQLLDWTKTKQYTNLVSTEDIIDISIKGDSSIFKEEIKPSNNLEVTTDKHIQSYLKSFKFNEEYFKGDQLVKNIPAGKTIVTATYMPADNMTVPDSIFTKYTDLKIDADGNPIVDESLNEDGSVKGAHYTVAYESESEVKVARGFSRAIQAVLDFFIGLYNSI